MSCLALLALAPASAQASERPALQARAGRPDLPHDASLAPAATARRPTKNSHALAHHPGLGAPSLLATPNAPVPPVWLASEAVARLHLERHRDAHGISPAVVSGARLLFVHDLGRGGIIVALRTRVGDIDVFHGDVKVLLDRQRRPLAITGTPHPAATAASARPFKLAPAAALHTLLADLGIARATPLADERGWSRFALTGQAQPARSKPVYFPIGDALVPGHLIEIQHETRGALEVLQYVVSADDGRLLMRRSATASDSFKYRVWADDAGDHRPSDGPLVDWTPHPTGKPDQGPVDFAAPVLVDIEGFNTNPDGFADPWLAPGATHSLGNNVDAYVDHDQPNGFDDADFRASITAPGVFDHTYDLALAPLDGVEQSMAATTQLFYVNNWMHDFWYDSGFVEATGVAQASNFGRGGVEGDVLRAEAQDAALQGARNNANMSTPMDGKSPTMQMYLWSGITKFALLSLKPADKDFEVAIAQFGPPSFDLEAPIVLVDDGAGKSPTDGCEAPTNNLAGKIALIDRGNCTFEVKVTFAQEAGAVGTVIADNIEAPSVLNPGNDAQTQDPLIPTLGTTLAAGVALKAAIKKAPQTAHMQGESSVERDGTIDNMIVAHEWGHYIHRRLVDCSNVACGAESEGWGDFNAIFTALREGDDLDGVYAASLYAAFDTTGYFGIRRVPYSVDFTKNSLTFRHISDGEAMPMDLAIEPSGNSNSEVHNAGEIWATMMWEAYIALHKAHAEVGDLDFAGVRRRLADIVVGGMLLAPDSPTFLEQRDALILAAGAIDPADFDTVAGAFARRGAGSCAVSPPRHSLDLVGVQEDYQLRANGVLLGANIDDSLDSCDGDGVLDVGELGRVELYLYNAGAKPLPAGAVVEVWKPDPALVFPDGPTLLAPALAPLTSATVTIPVSLAAITEYRPLTLTLRITTPNGCQEFLELPLATFIHADLQEAAARDDSFEASPGVWSIAGGNSDGVWRRISSPDHGFFWHADDVGRTTDTRLVSPTLQVSADQPLLISFDHAHSFEASMGTFWDGGVIEVLVGKSKDWVDISTLAAVTGYNGVLASEENPLNGRSAFVGESEGYPALITESLNLSDTLAGESIVLRFRVGTDAAAGAPGWDIDNVRITGIDNTPFPIWQVDRAQCAETSSAGTSDGGTTAGDTSDTGQLPTEASTPGTSAGDSQGDAETGTSDTAGAVADDDDDGCGCRHSHEPRPLAALALLLLLRRRRPQGDHIVHTSR
jgi:hypothetical protein